MTGVFEALGDASRRRVLALLAGRELTVGALVTALREIAPISQPAVSQHLKVLREAGLVSVRPDGTRRAYSVDSAGLEEARAWLAAVADPMTAFAQPLDALATEVARGRRTRRATGRHPNRATGGSERMTS